MQQSVDAHIVLGICTEVRAAQHMYKTECEPQRVTCHSKHDVLKHASKIRIRNMSVSNYSNMNTLNSI